MTARVRTLAIAFTALAMACGSAQAQHFHGGGGGYRGGYHGGYHGGGWGGPGLLLGGIGLGVGLGLSSYYYQPYDYVVVDQPPPVYYNVPPVTSSAVPQAPVAAAMPNPIFYPRNGQSASQTEADRQACNRWATSQPTAMADAAVFQRATLACMDGRGYTSR